MAAELFVPETEALGLQVEKLENLDHMSIRNYRISWITQAIPVSKPSGEGCGVKAQMSGKLFPGLDLRVQAAA